jgi:carboxymethylenebutenolidase
MVDDLAAIRTTTTAACCRPGLDQAKLRTDMLNGARFLKSHKLSSGKLGDTGFCWGGRTTNFLATVRGADLQAGVPFYGAAAANARARSVAASTRTAPASARAQGFAAWW